MLLNDFFYIITSSKENELYSLEIELNAGHKIFEGHFPGKPVVPGVCLMQMVQEVTENILENKTNLQKADEMKFLSIINPIENKSALMELKINTDTYGMVLVNALIKNSAATCFKFKGCFIILPGKNK